MTEFVANSVTTKSRFVATELATQSFVANSVATKSAQRLVFFFDLLMT